MPPPPAELPANVVAVVAQVPDRGGERGGVTTAKEFHHALAQVAAEKRRSAPKPGGNGYRRLQLRAMGILLDDSWIRGQAAEMGIGLRPPQVSRELARLKKKAFKSGAQYRRFLHEAHFTRRDVRGRVELQMFSERIEVRVTAGQPSAKAARAAFARFVREYEERWRARTVCAADYVTTRCSNGPPPKTLKRLAVF